MAATRNEETRPGPDERLFLCRAVVTLNGERASVSGSRNEYATVTQLSSGLSAEWSWVAVRRVVAAGGNFKS